MAVIRDGDTLAGAAVDSSGRLSVNDVANEALAAAAAGEAFSTVISETPTAAGDFFFFIVNESATRLMKITRVILMAAADEDVQVSLGDAGTAAGGGAQTPTNKLAGGTGDTECTAEGAVDITGLSGGAVVDSLFLESTLMATEFVREFKPPLIIPSGERCSLIAVAGAIAIKGTMDYYYV